MLTKKQAELFRLIEVDPEHEPDMREYHKVIRRMGIVNSTFTEWLEDCLNTKWRNENKHTYVGD